MFGNEANTSFFKVQFTRFRSLQTTRLPTNCSIGSKKTKY